MLHISSPYRSPYALGGLGAAGYSCSSTLCTASTAAMKTTFMSMQTALNALLATTANPPAALGVDGKIGSKTKGAVITAATLASAYPDFQVSLPTLLGYGGSAPTLASIAANAGKIASESAFLLKIRNQAAAGPDPASETADAAAATANESVADLEEKIEIAQTYAPNSVADLQAQLAIARERARLAEIAVNAINSSGMSMLPSITGRATTDRLIYLGAGVALVGGVLWAVGKRSAPRAAAGVSGARRRS